MKKYLIAVLLTACLLFSFGTTAFADPSGGQTPNTDGASNSVTQNEETYTITYVDGVGNTFQTNTYNKSVTTTVIEDIPTREGYIFDKWKDEKNNKSYKKGNELPKESITLTAQWKEKTGHFGYYLSDSNAHWVKMPADVIEYQDDNGKTKYSEKNAVAHGDITTVTSEIPELEGHVFLGWGDKERKDNGPVQAPAIRKGGETVKYYYNNKVYYTLDALWGSLTANGDTKVYDGERFELKPAVLTLNDNGWTHIFLNNIIPSLRRGPLSTRRMIQMRVAGQRI